MEVSVCRRDFALACGVMRIMPKQRYLLYFHNGSRRHRPSLQRRLGSGRSGTAARGCRSARRPLRKKAGSKQRYLS